MDGQLVQAIAVRRLGDSGGPYGPLPDVLEMNFDGESMLATLRLGAVGAIGDEADSVHMQFASAVILDSRGQEQTVPLRSTGRLHTARTTLALNGVKQLTIEYMGNGALPPVM